MSEQDCKNIREQFALLLYGELSFDEEERIDSHLDGCADCRTALARQKVLHEAVDAAAVTPSPALLNRCREDLAEILPREKRAAGAESWWSQIAGNWKIQFLKPVGAVALLAIGFFAAKVTPGIGGITSMGLADIGGAQVRNVAAQPDGTLRIVFDEKRERTISGNRDDQRIRQLLMAAAKEATDPGLRAQTVTILVGEANESDVREALAFAMANDENTNVRLKAMEGLERYASDPMVQNALAHVLLNDPNTGMRTRVIDALTGHDAQALDPQMVGALQELMSREDDSDVRERARQMLHSIKASAETY
ncbi:MAG TPA: HEAT repeat domain-containing protein [Bryobacteraceae bacterium]|nr:HEAT repeat domain-containing protein [Bryobacteraceae bacterium]